MTSPLRIDVFWDGVVATVTVTGELDITAAIEQAKGIIMAQSACGDADAFDKLREASQRSNVPVRELAAQLVAKSAGMAGTIAAKPRGPARR